MVFTRCIVLAALFVTWADGFGFPTTFLPSKTHHLGTSKHNIAVLQKRPFVPLSRRKGVPVLALRAAEERKFAVGDVVEAQWIGDDSWYAGKIEGLWANGAYDVMWADPQGLAPTQATLESSIRKFDPVRYYKFGLNAMDQEDVETAYLSFRTILILVGDFGKTREYLKELLDHPTVVQIAAERGDGELLSQPVKKMEYTPEERKQMGMPDVSAAEEEQGEDEMYSQEELLKLRDEAREESMTQDMWRQYNVFLDAQVGIWKGIWTDYTFDDLRVLKAEPQSQALVEAGTRHGSMEMAARINDGGFPEHSVKVDVDGSEQVLLEKQGFFPATDCSWFVANAHTQARMTGKQLDLEVGLRHTDSRARVVCRYTQGEPEGEAGAAWTLERVTVAREALEREPTAAEDPCLFGDRGINPAFASEGTLSGPADRLSTQLYNAQQRQPVVTVDCEGAIRVTCPTSIPETEEVPTNKEIVLEWSTTARPGVGWDGKDRIIPALHYRCARVFKKPSAAIEMLSLTENAPRE